MTSKRVQLLRNSVQLLFLVLLIVGLYLDLRMVLMVFLPGALFFGNFFCGWACPYGTMQEFLGKIGSKLLKRKFKMPKAVQRYLQFTRYLLFPLVMLGVGATVFELINGYGSFLSIFMNGFVLSASAIIMISFLVIALFFERPFCNYLCTEGVKYGLLSLLRVFTIKRKNESCINCKKCDKACPMNITISDKTQVRNAQCINCFKCVDACPVKDTLSYGFTKITFKTKSSDQDPGYGYDQVRDEDKVAGIDK